MISVPQIEKIQSPALMWLPHTSSLLTSVAADEHDRDDEQPDAAEHHQTAPAWMTRCLIDLSGVQAHAGLDRRSRWRNGASGRFMLRLTLRRGAVRRPRVRASERLEITRGGYVWRGGRDLTPRPRGPAASPRRGQRISRV